MDSSYSALAREGRHWPMNRDVRFATVQPSGATAPSSRATYEGARTPPHRSPRSPCSPREWQHFAAPEPLAERSVSYLIQTMGTYAQRRPGHRRFRRLGAGRALGAPRADARRLADDQLDRDERGRAAQPRGLRRSHGRPARGGDRARGRRLRPGARAITPSTSRSSRWSACGASSAARSACRPRRRSR